MILELSKTQRIYIFHTVPTVEVALSIRQLSTMLKSGIGIDSAIDVLSNQVSDLMLKEAYIAILKDIRLGTSLAESMKKHPKIFSDIIISIVSVGEQGGTLEKNLIFLADYLKKDYELKKKVKGATTYPLIVLFLTMVEMIGVIYFILPKLETVFANFKDIPPLTKTIMQGAKFIRENGVYLFIGIVIIFIIISRLLATKAGKKFKDYMALHIPVFKDINKKNILATFSRTLGILLASGVPLQKALSITQETISNHLYVNVLTKVNDIVKTGKSVAEALATYHEFFPPTFTKMIEIGEETGTLEENLTYLYEFYADEVLDMSNNLTTLLEPLLLIFVGVMIGGLALLIITPIYQLTGSINT